MSTSEPLPPREAGAIEEAAWSLLGGLVARHPTRALTVREEHGLLHLYEGGRALLTIDRGARRLLGCDGSELDLLSRFASTRRLAALLAEVEPFAGLPPGEEAAPARRRTLEVAAQLLARTRGPLGWLELRPVPVAGAQSVFAATLHALAGQLAPGLSSSEGDWLALRIVTPWGPDPRGPIGFLRPDGALLVRLGRPAHVDLWADGDDVRDAAATAARALSLSTS